MPAPDRDVIAWLVGPEGSARVREAAARLEDQEALAVGTRLRDGGVPPARAAAVTSAAATRLRARGRYADADRLLFTPELFAQASHPAVAGHRAARFDGPGPVVDLCCGAGGDALALAEVADVVAVDRDPVACLLAAHNLAARGHDRAVVTGDAVAPPVRGGAPVHADPARRAGGRRRRSLAGYVPAVPDLLPVLRAAAGAALTVSPGVALDDPDLPPDGELEFLQVGGDLVEAVVWLGDLRRDGVAAGATLLTSDGQVSATRLRRGRPVEPRVGPVGAWLVEVAPAVVRARLHDQVAVEIGAHRIARCRALLSSAERPPASPLYRSWELEAVLPPRARDIRRWLADADPLPLEVATHGVEVDPERLLVDLGAPPRGPCGRRLHLVRLDDGAAAYATRAS